MQNLLLLLQASVLLHVEHGQTLGSAWTWAPSVLIGCAALVGLYLAAVGRRITKRAWWYLSGVLVLLLALISPLDKIGEIYLLSVHMIQHLLFWLIVPTCLLLGIPRWLAEVILNRPVVRRIERTLAYPAVSWCLGIGTIWIWHLPALYNAALVNHNLHILEHLFFLVTSTIFWWPILTPIVEERFSALGTLLYVMAAGIVNTFLSIILSFIPVLLYPAYLQPHDPFGLLPLFREQWGITPQLDQQMAGFIMAVPGGLAYSVVVLTILIRWFKQGEEMPASPEQA